MMNYQIEQALSNKVDSWRFHSLESEVNRLKQENSSLQTKLGRVEGSLSNCCTILDRLIVILMEHATPYETAIGELNSLKNY